MKRVALQSSSLRSLGYDPEQQILEVEFSSGALYRYEAVPPEVVQALLEA
ncbi:MAG TPA: KTSC domain-containing protein, partial [Pseudomonas sp.]|nr:KTSC domain-containing protein [Pseudomonas sp.]